MKKIWGKLGKLGGLRTLGGLGVLGTLGKLRTLGGLGTLRTLRTLGGLRVLGTLGKLGELGTQGELGRQGIPLTIFINFQFSIINSQLKKRFRPFTDRTFCYLCGVMLSRGLQYACRGST